MRLIDADRLLRPDMIRMCYHLPNGDIAMPIGDIEHAPTVDAVPMVHGRWVMDEEPHDGDVRCSVCHIAIDQMHERNHGLLNALTGGKWHTFYHYCPHCGAKMDLEEDQSKCTSTDTRP